MRYSSLGLVRAALPRARAFGGICRSPCSLLGLTSLLIGLARPVVVAAVPTGQTTVILAMDVSRSMCSNDIAPSRLEVAEAAAISFIQQQGSTRLIGVVAFAGFGEIVQAPTNDREAAGRCHRWPDHRSADGHRQRDPRIASTPSPRSIRPWRPPRATVARARRWRRCPRAPTRRTSSSLLTDGVSNAGPEPTVAAQQAVDRGVRIYTIGFGTANPDQAPTGCPSSLIGNEPFGGGGGGFGGFGGGGGGFRRGIDEQTLTDVAHKTGGEYYAAESAQQLNDVLSGLPTYLILKHQAVEVSVVFAAIGVLLAGLALLLAHAWRPWP